MSAIGIELGTDQLVLTKGRDFHWSFENLDDTTPGNPIAYPAGDLYFELHTFGQQNAIQEIAVVAATGGTYKLVFDGEPTADIAFDLASEVGPAIEALPNVGVGNVKVSPATLLPVWEIALTLNFSSNEIQNISFINSPTGGTYRLSFGNKTTGDIAWNATAADVQAALEGLSTIGTGQVAVTDDGVGGFNVEFLGTDADSDVAQLVGISRGWGFGLEPAPFFSPGAEVTTSTVVGGHAKMSEPLLAKLQDTLTSYFNSFSVLGGVGIQMDVIDEVNIAVKITSQKSFAEKDLILFSVDVTSDALKQYFNSQATWLDSFSTVDVQFYWYHDYTVEFTGALGDLPQPLITSDITNLEGITGEKAVVVAERQAGVEEFTRWHFDIDGSLASLKVESDDVDKIVNRTKWQLVFLAEGEESGGDPVGLGIVKVQGE